MSANIWNPILVYFKNTIISKFFDKIFLKCILIKECSYFWSFARLNIGADPLLRVVLLIDYTNTNVLFSKLLYYINGKVNNNITVRWG